MLTVASQQTRTIIGRLDRGDDLIDALKKACRARKIRCGAITALGALQSVEVTHYDTEHKRYGPTRALAGPLEVLSAVGNISEKDGELSLHLHATLSREGDNGIELLGGHLLGAKVFALEFVITAMDDVMLRRGFDRRTGLMLWNEAFEADELAEAGITPGGDAKKKAPKAKAKAGKAAPDAGAAGGDDGATSWDDVAAASAAAQGGGAKAASTPAPEPEPEPEEEDEPEEKDEPEDEDLDYSEITAGDIVIHPSLGRCTVARIEGDDEYIQARLKNGRLVRLSLDVIMLRLTGFESGHQVFQAKIDV